MFTWIELSLKYPNTKQKILSAALDLFSLHGYAGSSIRQISGSVGLRESTIYSHYKSKEEIFRDILSEFKSRSIGKEILSDDLLDELSDPEKFLKDFSKRLIDHWNKPEEKKFIRLLLMEQFTQIGNNELSVVEYLGELKNICKLIFGEMVKTKIIKESDPILLSNQFIAPLFLLRTEYLLTDEQKNINRVYELADNHADFFWKAISRK